MTEIALVKCHICNREDKPEKMATISILERGEKVPGFAHRDCYDRDRTKMARFMYKHRDRADKRKSFEEWCKQYGY